MCVSKKFFVTSQAVEEDPDFANYEELAKEFNLPPAETPDPSDEDYVEEVHEANNSPPPVASQHITTGKNSSGEIFCSW